MNVRPHSFGAVLLAAMLAACEGAGAEAAGAQGAEGAFGSLTTSGVDAAMTVQSWGSGYCANVTLTNTGAAAVTGWTLVVALNQSTLSNVWSATAAVSGGQATITPADYNATIPAGAAVGLGFCGNATGSSFTPTLVSLAVVGGSSGGGTSSGGTSSGGTSSGGTSSGGTSSGGTSSGGTSSGGTSSGGTTTYALTVSRTGTGSGTVSSTPSGIACGSTCSATYASGSTVTLTAVAASGSSFTGWSGACTGSGACVLGMTADRSVAANFQSTTSTAGALVGWATQGGTVTGGGSATPVTVSTLSALNSAASGTGAAVIRVSGTISGNVSIGSNKTIEGVNASATIKGSIRMKGSANVILRNLNVVGYNCSDSPSDCQNGADAIGVDGGAHHLWFDHLAVSDGSDGNMDFTHAADYVTVSWTKFFYSGRAGGHQFSNLIGHSDSNAAEDAGHLRITFHHCWWANGVGERMPRVRFGQVHVYDSLYTASGNNYCVAPAKSASVLVENNVFIGVSDPIDLSYGDGAATVRGNLFTSTSGNTSGRGTAFTPPYAYTLDAASSVEAAVRAGAGPR